jgi:hypothetical protein
MKLPTIQTTKITTQATMEFLIHLDSPPKKSTARSPPKGPPHVACLCAARTLQHIPAGTLTTDSRAGFRGSIGYVSLFGWGEIDANAANAEAKPRRSHD